MKFLISIPAIVLLLLLRVALRLGVDYWDAYDYLTNALYLVGKEDRYYKVRPPMVSFLNAPHLLFRSHFSFVAPHLIALVMSALALIALYFLLRTSFDSGLSLLGVALLALNPLFIHYSVFALSDMPSMAFITLGFALYLRTQKSAWGFLGAVLSRYTTLLTFGSLLLFELIKGKRIKRFILVSLLALTAFYLIHFVLFIFTVRPAWRIPFYIFAVLRDQLVASQETGVYLVDPIYEYPVDFYIAFTLPVVLLGLPGIYRCLRDKKDQDILMLCWFVPVLLFLTFVARHKEARYLFCVFPPFLYFVIKGFSQIPVKAQKWAMVTILILPGVLAFTELKRFEDPVYSEPCLERIAQQMEGRKLNGMFTLYPKDHHLFPQDEFMYFHHINEWGMKYWTGEPKDGEIRIKEVYTSHSANTPDSLTVLGVRCR